MVEYSLGRSMSPTSIAEYQTMLPSQTLLRSKLHEIYQSLTSRRSPVSVPRPTGSATSRGIPRYNGGMQRIQVLKLAPGITTLAPPLLAPPLPG